MTDQVNAPVSDPNPGNVEDPNPTVVLLDEGTPPVVPPVVAPSPAADEADTGVVEYEPTGDVGLDMALAFVGKAGFRADHPAMKAAVEGDFDLISAELAAKGVAGWEQFIKLGKEAYAKQDAAAKAKQAELQTMVEKVAGGKEQWAAVQSWASANATPQEKAEINALLKQGGLAAKGAVKYLVDTYSAATNVVVDPADPTSGASRTNTPTVENGPLTAREYATEVAKLNTKLGGRIEGTKEYANLQRRRQAGSR